MIGWLSRRINRQIKLLPGRLSCRKGDIMRTIFVVIYFAFYLIVKLPMLWKVRRLRAEGNIAEHDRLCRQFAADWGKKVVASTGSTVTVKGMENLSNEPAVYIANHLSYFDVPVILGLVSDHAYSLLAKNTVQKVPIMRKWMEEFHCVNIDRDNPREAMRALQEAEAWIKKGYSFIIFPEGTRSKDFDVHEFKSGAFRVAQKTKVPVVPIALWNTQVLNASGSLKVGKAPVTMTILPVIETADFDRKAWRALPGEVETKVREAVEAEKNLPAPEESNQTSEAKA